MKPKPGQIIEYLETVTKPPAQAGKAGDRKTVGKDITPYAAAMITRGPVPYARILEQERPKQKPEAKQTKSDDLAEKQQTAIQK